MDKYISRELVFKLLGMRAAEATTTTEIATLNDIGATIASIPATDISAIVRETIKQIKAEGKE